MRSAGAQITYPGVPWSDLLPPLPSPTEPQPGPVPNSRVARSIEATAAFTAQLIAAAPVPGYGATRDRYCAEQLGLADD